MQDLASDRPTTTGRDANIESVFLGRKYKKSQIVTHRPQPDSQQRGKIGP